MRHARQAPRHLAPARRKLVWSTTDQSVTLIAGANTSLNLLAALSVAGSSLLGVTIMRTHLTLAIDTAVTAADRLRVGFVVDRVSEVGAASAITAADPELDWMLWRHETAAPTFGSGGSNVLEYDLRAKRRMQELNQAYLLCITNSAGGSKTITVAGRTLVALP